MNPVSLKTLSCWDKHDFLASRELSIKGRAKSMQLRSAVCNDQVKISFQFCLQSGGGGGTPYNGLYREAAPERGTFFSN